MVGKRCAGSASATDCVGSIVHTRHSRQTTRAVMAVFVTMLLLAGCDLRTNAAKSGREFGTWVEPGRLSDARYAGRIGEFSSLEVWNSWNQTEPTNDNWTLGGLDYWFDWASKRGTVRSTALIWGHDTKGDAPRGNFHPDYLRALNATQLREELKSHIQTMVRSFPEVKYWNVVNEPFSAPDSDGVVSLRDNIFKSKLGNDYVKEALQFAYQANPNAIFVAINEFNADGTGAKADKVYAYYKDKLVGAIPAANLAVGLQMHMDTCSGYFGNPDPDNIKKNIQRFGNLGVQVHITEMDFGVRCIDGTMAHRFQVQRNKIHDIVAACVAVPACKVVSMWGVGDADSWFRGYLGKNDWPLLFDDDYKPKPAYSGAIDALNGR